jgi:hypothetical protein
VTANTSLGANRWESPAPKLTTATSTRVTQRTDSQLWGATLSRATGSWEPAEAAGRLAARFAQYFVQLADA